MAVGCRGNTHFDAFLLQIRKNTDNIILRHCLVKIEILDDLIYPVNDLFLRQRYAVCLFQICGSLKHAHILDLIPQALFCSFSFRLQIQPADLEPYTHRIKERAIKIKNDTFYHSGVTSFAFFYKQNRRYLLRCLL